MAQLSAPFDLANLTLRVISAAVLLPSVVALVWLGGWPFVAFIALIGAGLGWEYAKLCGGSSAIRAIMMALLCAAPAVLVLTGRPLAAIGWGVLGAVLVAVEALRSRYPQPALLIGGTLYLLAAVVAIAWLRLLSDAGALIVFWMVAAVVGTDVGAYFVGRMIGGPKLAPRISPSKTWAGLFGGLVCAALCGWVVARIGSGAATPGVATAGMGVAIVAQIGDLIESAVKRHFGVKDSGTMIPGHGGILDRLDGYLMVAPMVALVTVAGGNPLEW